MRIVLGLLALVVIGGAEGEAVKGILRGLLQ
jgi:hypothetical protein